MCVAHNQVSLNIRLLRPVHHNCLTFITVPTKRLHVHIKFTYYKRVRENIFRVRRIPT